MVVVKGFYLFIFGVGFIRGRFLRICFDKSIYTNSGIEDTAYNKENTIIKKGNSEHITAHLTGKEHVLGLIIDTLRTNRHFVSSSHEFFNTLIKKLLVWGEYKGQCYHHNNKKY
jgi:hypothetical protein